VAKAAWRGVKAGGNVGAISSVSRKRNINESQQWRRKKIGISIMKKIW
jgi:hypothetical protein